jgi:DNA-binding MarR family transcriptional regulator
MTHQDIAKHKPIGYWLKHADNVITERIDQVLSENGFTRSRWQVLDIVYQAGTITRGGLFDIVQTFIDARQLAEIIEEFIEEGWPVTFGERDGEQLTLTDAGKVSHETVFELQSEVRRRGMKGITEREYATVIDVLERMVENLQ